MATRLPVASRHRDEVERDDRRWLMAWTVMFALTLLLMAGGAWLYRVTGPHPEAHVFLRRLKHEIRWLIPGLKRKPNLRPEDAHDGRRAPHHVASGHAAHRANA